VGSRQSAVSGPVLTASCLLPPVSSQFGGAAMPLIPHVGRRGARVRLILMLIAGFLWLGVLLHLFPVLWMVTASFKPTREIFEEPFRMIPKEPTTASYSLLFTTVTATGM